MAKYDYLDFDSNNFPEQFQHTIDNVTYNFEIYYNALNDNYYIDISDDNYIPIVQGEKVTYGMPLFNDITDPRLPMTQIIPLDDDNDEDEVSQLNFPSIIHLEFVDTDPNVPSDGNDNSQADINPYGQDDTRGGDLS